MVRVEDSQGGVIAQYYYDPFGRRLFKDVGATRTCFFYTDEGLAGEFSSTGTQIRAFGYKPDSVWSTDPLFMTQAGTWFYFQNDRAGTPQSLVWANGFEVWSADYQAFGQAQVNAAGGITVNLRYPGQYYDAETGLHYNWHRYYNPQTGRYLTTDPIGLQGGINLYAYVSGNPLKWVDPIGLIWVTVDKDYDVLSDIGRFTLSRITSLIKGGGDPSFPGADPDEFIGFTRQLIQEWQSDPCDSSRNSQYSIGAIRSIKQTYRIFLNPGPREVLINDPDAYYYYQWDPWVADRTYDDVPGATISGNFQYWISGEKD